MDVTLTDGIGSVPRARTLTRDFFGPHANSQVVSSLELVASELVTNSIRHGGGGPISLRLKANGELQVEVRDSLAEREHSSGPIGISLQLVSALASDWGTRTNGAGRTIWASLQR